ncbi:molybdate transport system substrate-binding protein [Reichenbachiella faecimaris]|uniref:Molybdate transport system substrate-binding protein n=2 Tax=Reichenbachiella faecimaris TaxID=692418 RepID=A0A1W2G762_REIFA|nr:molybdate transport system substrate-binding protein [Reichenbachiella faecimaris]
MVFLVFFYVYPMSVLIRVLLCATLLLPATVYGQDVILRVAVASSLMPAMEEIKGVFESRYDITLELIPGASGTLTNQIMHGAPYDLFICANEQYGQLLFQKGFLEEPPRALVKGSLILWSDQPISNWSTDNTDTFILHAKSSDVQTIAIAQPHLAPYGDAAEAFLIETGILDQIKPKLIYGNNVSITNQYIYTHGANIVITSLASKIKLESKVPEYWYSLESDSNLVHTICRIKTKNEQSVNFQSFLLDPGTNSIFKQYGYTLIVQ